MRNLGTKYDGSSSACAHGCAELVAAAVRGIDEQLCLLDQVTAGILSASLVRLCMRIEEIVSELAAGKRVKEELSLVVSLPELGNDVIRIIADIRIFRLHQSPGRGQHGPVSQIPGLLSIPVFQSHLRLEEFPFRGA